MPGHVARSTILVVMMTLLPGCSLFITAAGIAPGVPSSREMVHKQFGPPQQTSTVNLINKTTGETRDFEVEHYRVHSKFAPKYGTGYYHPIMLFAEPVTASVALFDALQEVAAGHVLEFVYDDKGKTIGYCYPFAFMGRPSTSEDRSYIGDWKDPSQSNISLGIPGQELRDD
ncbi:MAG: hypothetical protein JNL58_09655 [Planctomyces sp.]|nr:hypothetical protein [Planctomyces sp.]